MKRSLLSLLMLILAFQITIAQDAEKSYKKAKNAYFAYVNDPAMNKDKIGEAITAINEAVKYPENQGNLKVWEMQGKIFTEVCTKDAVTKSIQPTYKPDLTAALNAFGGYKKVVELAQKKGESRDALDGIGGIQAYLNQAGALSYEAQDMAGAFNSFKASIDAHDMLKAAGLKSIFEKPEDLVTQYQYLIFCGSKANMNNELMPILEKMYKGKAEGLDIPAVYQSLYEIKSKTDSGAALKILQEGRQRHPSETSLLFSEINYYLSKGELSTLISKLEEGIAKEPNNVSLPYTLGNVYDQLAAKDYDEKKDADGDAKIAKAKQYYEKTLQIDGENYDALYSLGAIYYNKAARLTKELQVLSDDLSAEGDRKYKAKEADMMAAFEEGFPFFKKAESVRPNEQNVLIALKEILVRKRDMNAANEFDARLKKVQSGGKNEPYKW